MIIEEHPFGYNISERFPNAREVKSWECGRALAAEADGRPYLIIDEGTFADFFLGTDDEDLLDRLLKVIEFESAAERAEYMEATLEIEQE